MAKVRGNAETLDESDLLRRVKELRPSESVKTALEEVRSRLATVSAKRPDSLLTIQEVTRRTSLSRATIYRLEKAGKFPARRELSTGRVGWDEFEVDVWRATRKTKGRA